MIECDTRQRATQQRVSKRKYSETIKAVKKFVVLFATSQSASGRVLPPLSVPRCDLPLAVSQKLSHLCLLHKIRLLASEDRARAGHD